MRRRTAGIRSGLFVAFVVVFATMLGCGGGSDAPAGQQTPPPPGGGGGGSAQSTGRLWHDAYVFDNISGTQIASLDGGSASTVVKSREAFPWADGEQFLTLDWKTIDGGTRIETFRTDNRTLVHQVDVEGFVQGVRPSPLNKNMILAIWGETSLAPPYMVVYDLGAQQLIDAAADAVSADWLPDGRVLLVSKNGSIRIATVGDMPNAPASGALSLPTAWQVARVSVSPKGGQMAVALELFDKGSRSGGDVWVAALDGSGLARLTQSNIGTNPVWSHDGKQLAFELNTGSFCVGGVGCAGTCDLWHAPPSVRSIYPVGSSSTQGAERFRVKNQAGNLKELGCNLFGWTR